MLSHYSILALSGLALVASKNFSNPVVYSDFADNDVFYGPDGNYYFSASNMHYSPGAPILRSGDLVNWEIIGHSVPTLNFGEERYDLDGSQAYRAGTWASTMRYRESDETWYWIGCIDFWVSYTYTAPSPTGPWSRAAQSNGGTCYYDCGLLIDDDDTMYVVYGGTNVSLAQLSADGLSQVKTQHLFSASDVNQDGIEGNRMYKRNGIYYVLDDHPGDKTYIWKSDSPWGPYEAKLLVNNVQSPVPGGGAPHQGSLVKTPEGDWYFMSFTWAYPAGRMPVLAPIVWDDDDWPVFVSDGSGGWGASYAYPQSEVDTPSWYQTDGQNPSTVLEIY
jgi:beta-xylosidase